MALPDASPLSLGYSSLSMTMPPSLAVHGNFSRSVSFPLPLRIHSCSVVSCTIPFVLFGAYVVTLYRISIVEQVWL